MILKKKILVGLVLLFVIAQFFSPKKNQSDLKLEESKLFSQKNVLEVNQYMKKVDAFKIKVNKFNQNKKSTLDEFNKKKRDFFIVTDTPYLLSLRYIADKVNGEHPRILIEKISL